MNFQERLPNYLSYIDLLNQLPAGTKPTYVQLLFTWEWVGFREQIKARDNFSCMKCGVTTITEYTEEEKRVLLEKQRAEVEQEPFMYFGENNESERQAREQEGSLSDLEVLKMFGILRLKNEIIDPIGYLKSSRPMLEVHHKSYKFGALPWKYPTDWLITLCNTCHHEIHFGNEATRKVYKDFKKQEEVLLHKCGKCGGSGYIPEYAYINSGVCYQCWGYGGALTK